MGGPFVYRQQHPLALLVVVMVLGGKNSSTGNWTWRNMSQGSSWQLSSPQLQSLVGMQ